MFYVFNKQKICSYLIAASAATLLLVLSFFLTKTDLKTIETASGVSSSVPIYSVDTTSKRISITINCAWSADDIDKILDVLDKCNVKVTFFMVGDWVDKNKEKVKKISEKGHEIANHSDKHLHVNSLSYEENVKEITNCSEKVKNITGKEVNLYRCPYGEYNDTVIKAATDNGYKVIQWSIDTLDYQSLDGSQMWDRINKDLKNRKYNINA
ncbi:MAG: polysaccharide deacetylase family protein [Clostridia bacterium]|nr:polysaccharide deacetylase family protein [Clostridia bacterium]